ncbi:MAG: VaFE repeat-containing surface-anchored protein [Propionibacteriaceae bacterium]|jgi:LPXTG-motif cell wall-anchored protein|nr:VaFE repeat-containing surface-anchored protein [Propionibacteriaceae bacterium]
MAQHRATRILSAFAGLTLLIGASQAATTAVADGNTERVDKVSSLEDNHPYGWRIYGNSYGAPVSSLGERAITKNRSNLEKVYFCRDYHAEAPAAGKYPSIKPTYYIGYPNTEWGGTETRKDGNETGAMNAIQKKEGAALGWAMWELASVATADTSEKADVYHDAHATVGGLTHGSSLEARNPDNVSYTKNSLFGWTYTDGDIVNFWGSESGSWISHVGTSDQIEIVRASVLKYAKLAAAQSGPYTIPATLTKVSKYDNTKLKLDYRILSAAGNDLLVNQSFTTKNGTLTNVEAYDPRITATISGPAYFDNASQSTTATVEYAYDGKDQSADDFPAIVVTGEGKVSVSLSVVDMPPISVSSDYPGKYESESQKSQDVAIWPGASMLSGSAEITITDGTLQTTASDQADGDKTVSGEDKQTVVDTVHYENLEPKTDYVLVGTLYDTVTGKPVPGLEKVSKTVTSDEDGTGDWQMVFGPFDASALGGHKLVVFENLLEPGVTGKVVISHENPDDEGQTVKVKEPIIPTEPVVEGPTESAKVAEPTPSVDSPEEEVLPFTGSDGMPWLALMGAGLTLAGVGLRKVRKH